MSERQALRRSPQSFPWLGDVYRILRATSVALRETLELEVREAAVCDYTAFGGQTHFDRTGRMVDGIESATACTILTYRVCSWSACHCKGRRRKLPRQERSQNFGFLEQADRPYCQTYLSQDQCVNTPQRRAVIDQHSQKNQPAKCTRPFMNPKSLHRQACWKSPSTPFARAHDPSHPLSSPTSPRARS